MSKYSFELKKKIVKEYLNGEGGYVYLSKKYGIPSIANIQKWVNNYKKFGEQVLLSSRQNKKILFRI